MIPRGKYLGERIDKAVCDEAKHFIKCPAYRGRGESKDRRARGDDWPVIRKGLHVLYRRLPASPGVRRG